MSIFLLIIFVMISVYVCISLLASIPILTPTSSLEISQETIKYDWGTSYEAMIKLLPEQKDFSIRSFDGTIIK